jgi:hypothetical protein
MCGHIFDWPKGFSQLKRRSHELSVQFISVEHQANVQYRHRRSPKQWNT